MNVEQQQSTLISTIEASIAQKEKQLSELSFALKVEKAQLRRIKKVFDTVKNESKEI